MSALEKEIINDCEEKECDMCIDESFVNAVLVQKGDYVIAEVMDMLEEHFSEGQSAAILSAINTLIDNKTFVDAWLDAVKDYETEGAE